jgi:predicted transcriptional regulator of viral defense system
MSGKPDWNALFETASVQDGYFTTGQAAEAGYSRPLLARHLAGGRIVRAQRGIYRVVHYPSSEHEHLVVVWLWSGREGVFSHETALTLFDLSDALPARVHLTVPEVWKARRLKTPAGVALHFANVVDSDRAWFGSVPVTSPLRTLLDCAADRVSPDLVAQAQAQALRRGLIAEELASVQAYVSGARGGA